MKYDEPGRIRCSDLHIIKDPKFRECVKLAGNEIEVDLFKLIHLLKDNGLDEYVPIVCKIHGEIPRTRAVKKEYEETLMTVLEYWSIYLNNKVE